MAKKRFSVAYAGSVPYTLKRFYKEADAIALYNRVKSHLIECEGIGWCTRYTDEKTVQSYHNNGENVFDYTAPAAEPEKIVPND